MPRLSRTSRAGAAVAVLGLVLVLAPAATAAPPRLLELPDLLPPVGNPDFYSTPYGTRLDVDTPGVLANDTDLDSTRLYAVLVTGTSHGVLTLDKDGKVRYEPDPGFSGVDAFYYKPFDGTLEALLAVPVTITVGPKPTATPTPTPAPTPTPTPIVVLPTLPIPTLAVPTLPAATASPTPTLTTGAPLPSPASGSTAGPTTGPGSVVDPSAGPTPSSSPTTLAGGGLTTGGAGPAAGGPDLAPTILADRPADSGQFALAPFGDVGMGIEWIVPTVLVTVPGALLIAIGIAQVFGGFVWLPLARRWLRGDGRRPARAARRLQT